MATHAPTIRVDTPEGRTVNGEIESQQGDGSKKPSNGNGGAHGLTFSLEPSKMPDVQAHPVPKQPGEGLKQEHGHHHRHHHHHHKDGEHHHHHHHKDGEHRHRHHHHSHHEDGDAPHQSHSYRGGGALAAAVPRKYSNTNLFELIMLAKEAHINWRDIEEEVEHPEHDEWSTCKRCHHVVRPEKLHEKVESAMGDGLDLYWCVCVHPDPILYEAFQAQITHCDSSAGLSSLPSCPSAAALHSCLPSAASMQSRKKSSVAEALGSLGAAMAMDHVPSSSSLTDRDSVPHMRRTESDSCLVPVESNLDHEQHIHRIESKARHADPEVMPTDDEVVSQPTEKEMLTEEGEKVGATEGDKKKPKNPTALRRRRIMIAVFSCVALLIIFIAVGVPVYLRMKGRKDDSKSPSHTVRPSAAYGTDNS